MQELGVDNVGSRHTTAKDHGDEDEVNQGLAQEVLLTGQHITHGAVQDDTQNSCTAGGSNRHKQGPTDGRSLRPQVGIRINLQRTQTREDLVSFLSNDVDVSDRDNEDDQDRREANDCQNQEKRIEEEIGSRLDPVQTVHNALGIFQFSHFSQPPT